MPWVMPFSARNQLQDWLDQEMVIDEVAHLLW